MDDAGTAKSRVGFVGLGKMGTPMAGRLLDAGFAVTAFSRRGTPQTLLDRGAIGAPDLPAVAHDARVVVTMLTDTQAVEDVLFRAMGLSSALQPGAVVLDTSTICPEATRRFQHVLAERGVHYVDAPVSGGVIGAEGGTLSIFVGGDAAPVAKAMPLLRSLGANITHLGPPGAGQTAKLVNQAIVAINIGAVAEGFALAARNGLDLSALRQALQGGFAWSAVMDVHGERIVAGDYEPGARLALHLKDLDLACAASRRVDLRLPHLEECRQAMAGLVDLGFGDRDHSFLAKPLIQGCSSYL